MSTRVYLSKHTCQTTHEEDTPVCIRIQLSRAAVKDLHRRLQHAYQRDDVRLVRRTTVLIDLLVHHVPVAVLCERWGLSPACIYGWQKAFLLRGLDSLVYGHGGGRHPKLSPKQKQRLVELIDAARRQHWLQQEWPRILRAAQRHKGLILFEDEASFAQWGSLSYTWARRGQQPAVKTSGKSKGYKVFGAIEYFSGRLFYQGIEGRFNSEHYQVFLQRIMAQTSQHLFVIHDGARYHTSASRTW